MSELTAKHEAIAAWIARDAGLGELTTLTPETRASVDRRTHEALASEARAQPELQRLIDEYRALAQLRADETNAVLAEKGEVFSPEDDA